MQEPHEEKVNRRSEALSPREVRGLPSIERLLSSAELEPWRGRLSHRIRVQLAREVVGEARQGVLAGGKAPEPETLVKRCRERYDSLFRTRLKKAINATGVVLHTNLGRAPLGREVLLRLAEELDGYSTLELAEGGGRGDRTLGAETLLCRLTGAEGAVVVNNNAAAVFLALSGIAAHREVVISRGELVQIGGGFKVPEILAASHARLVEVGTTNITRGKDYEEAITPMTACLLKVHQSCFEMRGHVEEASTAELAEIARRRSLPLVVDEGSGLLSGGGPEGLEGQAGVRDELGWGADLVCFSADKLLGGPQAGIIVGRRSLTDSLKRLPLYRALRLGKFDLFLLEQTLYGWISANPPSAWKMLRETADSLKSRVDSLVVRLRQRGVDALGVPGTSLIGGGTTPGLELPAFLIEVRCGEAERLARELLQGEIPVVVRRENGRVLLDLRTVQESEEAVLLSSLERAVRCSS